MIAVMPDFARIDRELAAIGTVPEAVQPLLDEYGQRDRSLENVDHVLEALREGRAPTSSPPDTIERPSFLPLGWDSGRKSEPGVEPAPPLQLQPEDITVNTGVPEAMIDETPVAIAADASASPAATANDAVLSDGAPLNGHVDTQQSSPPPPAAEPASEPAAEVEATEPEPEPSSEFPSPIEHRVSRSSRPPRPDLQALLDAELDPREFPSTAPPPPRAATRSSVPAAITSPLPPPRTSLPAGEPGADELELLVDDDDILEIEDEAE
jgi:hypothetical protein